MTEQLGKNPDVSREEREGNKTGKPIKQERGTKMQ